MCFLLFMTACDVLSKVAIRLTLLLKVGLFLQIMMIILLEKKWEMFVRIPVKVVTAW